MNQTWYEVTDMTENHVIATTGCMDNALDIIAEMESFDRAEGMFNPDKYKVRIKTVKEVKKNGNTL